MCALKCIALEKLYILFFKCVKQIIQFFDYNLVYWGHVFTTKCMYVPCRVLGDDVMMCFGQCITSLAHVRLSVC